MTKILKRLGYQGEVLTYVTRRMCGIWFIWIGLITVISAIFSNHMCINPAIFIIGYGVGFYVCYGNRKLLFDRGNPFPFVLFCPWNTSGDSRHIVYPVCDYWACSSEGSICVDWSTGWPHEGSDGGISVME